MAENYKLRRSSSIAEEEKKDLPEEKKDEKAGSPEEIKDEKKDEKKKDEGFKPEEKRIEVKFNRDMPEGKLLLTGARIITMNGDEVIENGKKFLAKH